MSRPPAGRAAFEAMGRSAKSRGWPMTYQRQMRVNWPRWAREAWSRGYIQQGDKA
jgi:hypothetical protein